MSPSPLPAPLPHDGAPGPLAADLYELTMAESYLREGLADVTTTFALYGRRLPAGWGYLVAAGIEEALGVLGRLSLTDEEASALDASGVVGPDLIDRLRTLRFTGSVRAMPEGTPAGPGESLLEVTAPLIQAQIVETAVLNAVHFSSLVAAKASRCVEAAAGRRLIDFSMRRDHGLDAARRVARSCFMAGFAATSDVEAGVRLGIPLAGTMAHSYVQAFDGEDSAFEAFTRAFPDHPTLLVDTYDTPSGVRRAVEAGRRLAERGGALGGVRLDSGDLVALSREARSILDEAGFGDVSVVASGGIDEREIARHVAEGAPIDAYGVGSRLGTVADAPYLDMAYKLVELDGRPVLKLSEGKATRPGRTQVWRRPDMGAPDVVALREEEGPADADPLLREVVRDGLRVAEEDPLEDARRRLAEAREGLPAACRGLDARPHPVEESDGVRALRARAAAAARARNPAPPAAGGRTG